MFQVQTVIQNNCTECHSKTPTHIGLSQPPAGVTFDNETEILSQIERINERAILRKDMPPPVEHFHAEGTDEHDDESPSLSQAEYRVLSAWVKQMSN